MKSFFSHRPENTFVRQDLVHKGPPGHAKRSLWSSALRRRVAAWNNKTPGHEVIMLP